MRNLKHYIFSHVYRLMWLIGFFLTLSSVYTNLDRYSRHESIITHQEFDQATSDIRLPFPIIIVCSNNMHMETKLHKYPILNDTILKFFYGSDGDQLPFMVSLMKIRKILIVLLRYQHNQTFLRELDEINVREMMDKTRAEYTVFKCLIGTYDCRRNWRFVGTISGQCLMLDIIKTNQNNKLYPRDQ